jgi:hypothetical protein
MNRQTVIDKSVTVPDTGDAPEELKRKATSYNTTAEAAAKAFVKYEATKAAFEAARNAANIASLSRDVTS